MDWLDNNVSQRLEKIADELLGEVSNIIDYNNNIIELKFMLYYFLFYSEFPQ